MTRLQNSHFTSPSDADSDHLADARASVDVDDVPRRIIHVDMDAFFASVEQRDNPSLRGRPVAVGRGKARGVVAAASYEARVFGVRSAMPSLHALRLCPDLVFVTPRLDRYREVSLQINSVFRAFTEMIEPLSLDEAYLDVTQACEAGATATQIAEQIRVMIRSNTGLTASAGVSYNKFLAKLASDQRKPDGLTIIRPSQAEAFVASLPVGRFHGVGPVTEEKMSRLGIKTGADLQALDMTVLRENFGNSATHYWEISRGIDDRPVRPHRERKSVGAETTFESDIIELEAAQAALASVAEKALTRAADKGLHGHTVTLKIKFTDFEQITRQRTLRSAITDKDDIARIAGDLLSDQFPFRLPIRLLGVSLSSLGKTDGDDEVQLSLFDL